VLRPIGVTQALLDRGDQATRVQLHLDGRDVTMPVFDFDVTTRPIPTCSSFAKRRLRRH
jgi:hypothetical protein